MTSASGINKVYIDGVLVANVDRYSASSRYAQTVWSSGTLGEGTHTITVTRGVAKNAASTGWTVIVDAFVVG